MIWILMAVSVIAAIYILRFYRLKKNLKRAAKELKEMEQNPEDNRILLISYPDKDAEVFLENMNAYIVQTRKERIFSQRRERELRAQIENISHDLRTPLTAIIGYLELLDMSKLEAEDVTMVETVTKKAKALQSLIGNFYDLSRLEMNDYRLQPEKVDLVRQTREASLLFYQEFEKRNLQVELAIPSKEVNILADIGALERILNNMLQNALRYADSKLIIGVEEDGDEAVLIFENDTAFLQETDVARIFERFYVEDKSRTSQSTGLGLTISKLLAETMGGTVNASLLANRLRIEYRFTKCRKP